MLVLNFSLWCEFRQIEVQDEQLVAPEFEILDDSTGLKTFVVFQRLIEQGLIGGIALGNNPRPKLDYTEELLLAADAPALVDHLNLLLCHQTLEDSTKAIIIEAIKEVPASIPILRVQRAILMISITPEFAILE